ncbi:hypothetical protein C1H46_040127 [Malus baccata]|uniref:Protein kinase domain-containing protein n=1 Tax=Malus baccata TaxID=106549 RepID=A0A540KJY5_MALBA|nr:hypothetical protein C1H46_040127 [Malus baccata]
MRTPILLLLFVLLLLSLIFCCSGDFSLNTYLSPSQLPNQPLSMKDFSIERARSILMSLPFASKRSKTWVVRPSLGTLAPARSPIHLGPSSSPSPRRGHHRHHHVRVEPHDVAPAPSKDPGCDQICVEPLTASPFGSPCGCVFPMKVKLLLDIAPYAIFPVMSELEIEIAEGTYLTQSQVKIMGASADSQNQGRTVVDINLVPLGERFDNTTAILTYDRFQHKKVPLNLTLFGNYEVVYISYPGIPSSPPYEIYEGHGPAGSAGGLPITADFGGKNQRMNIKTIMIIALSAFVLLVVLLGAIWVFVQWRRFGRPSSAVGPAFTSSIHKRSAGMGSILSSSIASSTSVSLMSTMATSILSVKTFPLAELEKATNKFSSQRVLGEGGFGRVYHGIMEDGTEVAVKVLTRDNLNQNGDREFIAEVEMLSRLHHRNLVKLIGICIEGRTRSLVYEIVRNGSVESHLHGVDKVNGPLDWEARMKIALGAARGLAYLHEDSNPRVIHRDFKASNVLLEADFTPKVSDFGLAREATEGSHHISTRVMGTFGYVAPEYAMTGHLLVKSDVYSYGVVLLELLSGRKPVDMSHPPGQENLVTWARPLLTSREGDLAPSDSSWWNAGGLTPRLNYGQASSFITMDYSSGPLEDMENRPFSTSSLVGDEISLPIRHGNRSGPLRTVRSKPAFYRIRGSRSEHSGLLPKQRAWNDGFWLGVGGVGVDFLAAVPSYPKPDEKIRTTSLKVQGGGNTGNALTCAARLGLTTRVISKIANDTQGRAILEVLRDDGIDTSFLVVSEEGNSPFTYVIVDNETKTRTCIFTPGYPLMMPDDLSQSSLSSALDGARIVYFDVRWPETALVVAQEAARKNIPILIDSERKREGLDDLITFADYAAWTEAASAPSALVSMLLKLPKLKFVIVTLGEDGCIMLERSVDEIPDIEEMDVDSLLGSLKQRKNDSTAIPTYVSSPVTKLRANGIGTVCGRLLVGTAEKVPPEELLDTTGAGDSFVGAVLYAICTNMPPEKMLPFAAQVGAICCRALGARAGLPHRTDSRLASFLS